MKKIVIGLCFLGLAACGSGSGSVAFTVYGEDYIEKEIPAAEGSKPGFVDGWSVKYDKFLVTLGELRVANHDGKVGAEAIVPVQWRWSASRVWQQRTGMR